MNDTLTQILTTVGIIAAICIAIAVLGLTLIVRSIRQLNVPRDAGFFATMHFVPLALVVLLDLLDLGLDVFAAPIAWIFLDRMGLPSLRNKAAIEALIPFSGPIPTFTIAWIAARVLHIGDDEVQQLTRAAQRLHQAQIIDIDGQSVSRYNNAR